jgi:hypothetical protein
VGPSDQGWFGWPFSKAINIDTIFG